MIRPAEQKDANAIATIYNHFILNTSATFEEQEVSEDEIINRIKFIRNSNLPWLVKQIHGEVIGYAYASKWRERSAYRFSVESTVYIANNMKSKGLGTELYSALFTQLKERNIHNIIGGITLPNPASVALHEKLGMKKVAHFEKVGFKFGQWLDVGYWQAQLDS
ncbi:arsinothricin resistance N-acetyltransferase ArsN1 family B [uncultured Microbulbifer sp.]|uniref:arsinothricin resistance N-acetyltransferase ArsN1 family B n=1 Tax=uncultured Microbulbifer sp. TaxID=348147 RepID=UPI002622D27D|nr:arsinothricin resistance N-acetyltransferase ArsN1 family B [uncultured Microbulbifer sp.]